MSSYFVAKQPILDVNLSTYGYELLFRSELGQNEAIFDDPDMATAHVVSYGFTKSQEQIKQNKKIFLNRSRYWTRLFSTNRKAT